MDYYVNTGAPIPRKNGSFIDRGAVFIPTEDECRRLAYKLRPASVEETASVVKPTNAADAVKHFLTPEMPEE